MPAFREGQTKGEPSWGGKRNEACRVGADPTALRLQRRRPSRNGETRAMPTKRGAFRQWRPATRWRSPSCKIWTAITTIWQCRLNLSPGLTGSSPWTCAVTNAATSSSGLIRFLRSLTTSPSAETHSNSSFECVIWCIGFNTLSAATVHSLSAPRHWVRRELALDRTAVVGHSMGGAVGRELAAEQPERRGWRRSTRGRW